MTALTVDRPRGDRSFVGWDIRNWRRPEGRVSEPRAHDPGAVVCVARRTPCLTELPRRLHRSIRIERKTLASKARATSANRSCGSDASPERQSRGVPAKEVNAIAGRTIRSEVHVPLCVDRDERGVRSASAAATDHTTSERFCVMWLGHREVKV